MGTVFSFDLRHPGLDPDALPAAVALLHRIDATYSTYRDDSVVCRLARGELTAEQLPLEVDEVLAEVAEVLAACRSWTERTDGWFDAYAAGSLDPSGYVKGWAIQQASELLVAAGSTSHSINGGGDVACVGLADDRPWRLGIVDPRSPGQVLATVAGADLALATSGIAERGQHVLDPHTGRPPESGLLSLSVSAGSVIDSDVYATAGFAMGDAARDWLADRGIRAFAVHADGSTWSTFG
jgi:thiamine biosynthesis lipoprotein